MSKLVKINLHENCESGGRELYKQAKWVRSGSESPLNSSDHHWNQFQAFNEFFSLQYLRVSKNESSLVVYIKEEGFTVLTMFLKTLKHNKTYKDLNVILSYPITKHTWLFVAAIIQITRLTWNICEIY